MLEAILGSTNKERVLIYLSTQGEGYAREIAAAFKTGVTPIQKQLAALEAANVIYCQPQGRTKLYALNPRYPFLKELEALLEKALFFYPPEEREALLLDRRRPRRQGKPLSL
ncbi:MAG: winged helix-turn-helix domain-containing protein [Moraxellaceae bacterium]|nr:winged helix-turn-helix domain-containing protein [Moraxellaceae bacterium]